MKDRLPSFEGGAGAPNPSRGSAGVFGYQYDSDNGL